MSGIGVRIREAAESTGSTLKDFAAFIDVPYSTLRSYLREDAEPPASFLEKIHRNGMVNVNWLLTGEGEKFSSNIIDNKILDKMLISVLPELVDEVLNNKNGLFTYEERAEALSILMKRDRHGLAAAVHTLTGIHTLDDLTAHLQELKAAARERQPENIERLKNGSSKTFQTDPERPSE